MGTAVAFAGETPPKMVTRLGIEPRTYGLRVVKHVFCRGVKWSFGGHFEAEVGVGVSWEVWIGVSWEVWRGVEWYLIWLANGWQIVGDLFWWKGEGFASQRLAWWLAGAGG